VVYPWRWLSLENDFVRSLHSRVQRNWLFKKKIKNTDPLIVAKFKSKTHLLNTLFILAPFLRVHKFEKSTYMAFKLFLNQKRYKKTQNFMLISNVKKKVIRKLSLTNMSKSGKSAYFRHVFANNFFWYIFYTLFQRIWNQREILRFLIPKRVSKFN
jgi:hypothetical protein